jgi:hypothetical protein
MQLPNATPESEIRVGKKSRSVSEMSIPFETILKFFDADPDPGIFLTLDPGSGMGKIRIRDSG